MTWQKWRQEERDRDAWFAIWKNTPLGQARVTAVRTEFPGLVMAGLSANDNGPFLRDMCFLYTHLHRTYYGARGNEEVRPDFSDHQLVLLVLLISPIRSLVGYQVFLRICDTFPYFKKYAHIETACHGSSRERIRTIVKEQSESYDCHFPPYGYLQDNSAGWKRSDGAIMVHDHMIHDTITLPRGEESYLTSPRYRDGDVLYYDVPPCELFPTAGLSGIERLPVELQTKILDQVCKVEGALVISFQDGPQSASSSLGMVRLPRHRYVPKSFFSPRAEHALPPGGIKGILNLRHVNKRWNDIILESFFSNVLVFPKRNDGRLIGMPDEWLVSTGPKPNRYKLLMAVQYRIVPHGNNISPTITSRDEVVRLQTSRETGCVVTGKRDTLNMFEEQNSFVYRSYAGRLIVPVQSIKLGMLNALPHARWESIIPSHFWHRSVSTTKDPGILDLGSRYGTNYN
jgi:hypothetical protein